MRRQTGEIARCTYDRKDQFLAAGLFDAESPIVFAPFKRAKPKSLMKPGGGPICRRLGTQERLVRRRHDRFRWINGESDGWPGFVLDRYERTLVVKIYTAA